MRQEQMSGTLEMLIVAPTSIYTLITAMVIWNLLSALFDIIIYIIAGIFIFKVDFGNINFISTLVIIILCLISFNALGIISASFTLAFKRGDPVSLLMNLGMEVLGGVFFPITVLPEWLRIFSYLFPITYAIRSLEKAVYQGASLTMLWQDIWVLVGFSLILIPIALWSLKAALTYALKKGTLVHY